MGKADCDIRIGTSGWYYDHWKERFYPPELPKSRWLEHYAEHFNTVELNNTFYHLPKEKTVQRWSEIVPKGFLYAVKASHYITHIKKLSDVADSLQLFFERVRLLEDSLGPVLYQLPPSLHKDLARLEAFIRLLPKKPPAIFEFRHQSWYQDDTFELLDKLGAGFCVHDLSGNESPRVLTGDIVYVRFHGTSGRYAGDYPESLLHDWAEWLKSHAQNARAIHAHFNNDAHGHAIKNAKTLSRELV